MNLSKTAQHYSGIIELAPRELGRAQFRDAESAYREGYLDRPERKERFAANLDMEPLQFLASRSRRPFPSRVLRKRRGQLLFDGRPGITAGFCDGTGQFVQMRT
jgi:hypothetical protein